MKPTNEDTVCFKCQVLKTRKRALFTWYMKARGHSSTSKMSHSLYSPFNERFTLHILGSTVLVHFLLRYIIAFKYVVYILIFSVKVNELGGGGWGG